MKRSKLNFLLTSLFLLGCSCLPAQTNKITVAQDGTGRYKTVGEALKAVPLNNKKDLVIFIRNGVYKEKLRLGPGQNHVVLQGEDKFNTILTYDDHTGKITPGGDTINTRTSASFVVGADDFYAENITFQNDAGFTAGQAVGLEVQGDRAVINNCRIVGNQDILFTSSEESRQYYRNCYIEGSTDFIFGAATAWFEGCHIHSRKNSHITAASTPQGHAYGYVFHDCVLTGDSTLNQVSLGRPWRPYGSVTYLYCYIDKHIRPEGWSNWNNTENYRTARYAEYKNYGPGAAVEKRVAWAHQLTAAQAAHYTMAAVFPGWNPLLSIRK
ncbi:MAG: pectin esterase [Williamsia sp.]|nr:pectin esterase [Williamsia sp.]